MPNPENVMQGAHSAPSASVLPTKQAHLIIPSLEALNAMERAAWRPLPLARISAHHTSSAELYRITIMGYMRLCNGGVRYVQQNIIYGASHPVVALGQAVCDFLTHNPNANITSIDVQRRQTTKQQ